MENTDNKEMEKGTSANTVIISSTVLGQKRAEYERLTDKGLPADRIASRMEEDALQFGISIEDYKSQLSNLKSRGSNGDNLEEKRSEHTSDLNVSFLQVLADNNGKLLDTTVESMTFSRANFALLKACYLREQTNLRDYRDKLCNTEFTTKRGKQGWITITHVPVHDFIQDAPTNPDKLFAPYVGGWSDKGRTYDQYGTRMEPGGKATFYRSISYETPVCPVDPNMKHEPEPEDKTMYAIGMEPDGEDGED